MVVIYYSGDEDEEEDKKEEVLKYSNPIKVVKNAEKYLGSKTKVYFSTRNNKKYMIMNPNTGKFSHFGQMGYSDYTLHNDPERRKKYLDRATNIKGNWKDDPYSPNNLSIHILWQ